MTESFKVACIQNCAGTETGPNLTESAALVREAAAEGARLICLPEDFTGLDLDGAVLRPEAFVEGEHPALPLFRDLARELEAWLLLGSLAIEGPGGGIFNRSYLIGSNGAIAARYDKIHLFDVDLAKGESYKE